MNPTPVRPASASLRRHVIEVALSLFNQRGYEAVSIETICGATEVSVGSLYHHFGNKAGVAAAVYAEAIQRYQEALLAIVERDPTAQDGVRSLVEAHHRWVATNTDWARFMLMHGDLAEIRADAATHQETNVRLAAALMAWAAPLMEAQQLIRLDSVTFLAAVFGPSYLHTRLSLGRSPEPPDQEVGSALADVAWHGLRGPAEVEPQAERTQEA